MRKFTKIFMIGLALFLFQTAIQAQTTGSLSGTATDPNGAAVVGAKVTLKNSATGTDLTTTTNDQGRFTFGSLQPGNYSVAIENAGFKKSVASDVTVSVSNETQVAIALEVGTANETVTVTSAQDVINTTSPTLTNVINAKQVVDLPLPTRNPLDLAALQAGIAVIGTGTRTASVAGLRGSATNVTQDGINAMDNFVKTDSFFAISAPSLGSTDEFSITTGTVDSSAGRGAAQVNIVTKGGTNVYHGSLFYLMRNSALEANSWFNNFNGVSRPDEHQHFFGFTIGGPVHFLGFGEGVPKHWSGKDKAFFFFSYEGFREKFQSTRTRTVFTAPARTGVFTYVGTDGVARAVNMLQFGNFHTLNPVTTAQLNAMPASNAQGGDNLNTAGFKFNVVGSDPSDSYVARYDHQLFKDTKFGSHKFEFVYSRTNTALFPDTFNSIESPFPGGTNAGQASKRNLYTAAVVSQFGSVSNVFRYGKQYAPVAFLRESIATAPYTIFGSPVSNYDNTFQNQGRNTSVKQYSDNVAMPKAEHVLKFGFDWEQVYAYTFNDAGINKTITLGTNGSNPDGLVQSNFPSISNNDFTLAQQIYRDLTGMLASASATFNVQTATSGFVPGYTRERIFKQNDVALYAQDQWRFRSNLTLNLGVRWEFEGVPTIPNGLAIQPKYSDLFGVSGFGNLFRPTAPAGQPAGIATQQLVSGDTGIGLYKNDWNNFAPFVGLAWSPKYEKGIGRLLFGGPGKSSIRMGYSISYLHDGFTTISNALGTGVTNPGLIQSASTNTPTGVLTAAGVNLTTPTFVLPITDRQNFDLNSFNGLWAIDPNIRVPYVQQWNIGYEREIFKDTAIEIRYTGNHAIKVWRAVDFNEVNIFENGFLNEYKNAQNNYSLYLAANPNCGVSGNAAFPCRFGNSGLAGQVNLPIMSTLFTGLSGTSGSGFASSGFISNLLNQNVGSFANTLAFSNTYKANRNLLASNFFVANPNAAFARGLSNDGMSNYNSLQIELRRRFSQGLQFQTDFTWSKALGNAVDASGVQSDLSSFRTLRNKDLDYRRSTSDQTYRFIANGIYELPFGKGKSFFSDGSGVVNQIVGGWTVGAIVTWQSRPPFVISSGRSTFNCLPAANGGCSVGTNAAQLVGITAADFKKNLGIFKTAGGIFYVNPAILDITTSPTTGKVLTARLKPGLMAAPAAGTFGNFPLNEFVGPSYFNVDMSVVKRFPIGERVKLELKTTFINILNHPNFIYSGSAFDSTSFGLLNSTSGGARVVHFTGTMNF